MRSSWTAVRRGAFVAGLLVLAILLAAQAWGERQPDPGTLAVIDKQGQPVAQCPLKHTDVKAEISGYIAEVTVTQQFHNPYPGKIDAVYTFPLSQTGAVYDMTMKVGDRTIRGQIHPREKARQIYEAARKSGHVATLLDQERPNIFTQSVANIEPGKEVEITITYLEVLPYEDGDFSFVFPTVVGPRYIPGQAGQAEGTGWAPDTDQVPDGSRITPPVTPKGTRAGHDISIAVDVKPGAPLKRVESVLHEVKVDRKGDGAHVELVRKNVIPNKDFILQYSTADESIQDAVLTHNAGQGGYFAFILQPPRRIKTDQVNPKELVFVVDTSGSMRGDPLNKVKETMRWALGNLNPKDTFNLITFAGQTQVLFPDPVPATPQNVKRALTMLDDTRGGGGTEMMTAIRTALAPSDAQEHLRVVVFMTDGYVGNDMAILDEIQKHPKARVFSFGVGSSVNRFLLDNMARFGRGQAEYITQGADTADVARKFYERVRHPVLTDISVDFDDVTVEETYPKQVPDLFASGPVVVFGRYKQGGTGQVVVRGTAAGKSWKRMVPLNLPGREAGNSSLPMMWARRKIDHLMASDWKGIQSRQTSPELEKQITQLGVDYRLMTQFTSFVAVEEKVVTEGGQSRTVTVPVEMPEGVSYEGVFGEEEQDLAGGRHMSRSRPMAAPAPPGGYTARSPVAAGADPMGLSVQEPLTPPPAQQPSKLDQSLRNAVQIASGTNQAQTFEYDGIKVDRGTVAVRILLHRISDQAVAQLKKLGLVVVKRDDGRLLVVGRAPLAKLEAMAGLGCVKGIEPAR